jgi:hypothetical protein
MRVSYRDRYGLVIATTITTLPLLAVTWFGESLSKSGGIGLPAYLLPTAIGLAAGFLASVLAVAADPLEESRPGNHFGFGVLVSFLLIFSYCTWWGSWCIKFAEQFRA